MILEVTAWLVGHVLSMLVWLVLAMEESVLVHEGIQSDSGPGSEVLVQMQVKFLWHSLTPTHH